MINDEYEIIVIKIHKDTGEVEIEGEEVWKEGGTWPKDSPPNELLGNLKDLNHFLVTRSSPICVWHHGRIIQVG